MCIKQECMDLLALPEYHNKHHGYPTQSSILKYKYFFLYYFLYYFIFLKNVNMNTYMLIKTAQFCGFDMK